MFVDEPPPFRLIFQMMKPSGGGAWVGSTVLVAVIVSLGVAVAAIVSVGVNVNVGVKVVDGVAVGVQVSVGFLVRLGL